MRFGLIYSNDVRGAPIVFEGSREALVSLKFTISMFDAIS